MSRVVLIGGQLISMRIKKLFVSRNMLLAGVPMGQTGVAGV